MSGASGASEYGKAGMLDGFRHPRPVEFVDPRQTVEHEQFRPFDVIGRERRVGRSAGQGDLPPGGVDHEAVRLVPVQKTADVTDIVGQAGDDEVAIVGRRRIRDERAPLENVVAGERDEHRMLDIVIEGVAVAEAFERELRGERDDLGETPERHPEAVFHVDGEEQAQRVGGEFGQGDHGSSPQSRLGASARQSNRKRRTIAASMTRPDPRIGR